MSSAASSSRDIDWSEVVIGMVGGDEREPEIARRAAATGASVRAFAFPMPAEGIAGVDVVASARDALSGARYALFPIPLGYEDGHLYAPSRDEPVRVDGDLLGSMAAPGHVFLGRSTPKLDAAANAAGVALHEYDPDRELMLLRAPAIVEGALQLAIEHTDITINDATAVVVGYGNIGSLLAWRLLGLGARVFVAARNPMQRAGAYAAGMTAIDLEQLKQRARDFEMVFSTVPARVVDADLLERLPPDSLVLDIAPPPHHADLEAASRLGHRAVWARGLGKRAPVTVGASQWTGLGRWIADLERERLRAADNDPASGSRR